MVSFVFPLLFMQKITLIFGYNNIINRAFSKNKIKNSRILYGLNTLLDGERLWILLINLSFLMAIPYFSEYANHFLEQLKYTFIHSFFAIFLLEHCTFTWILINIFPMFYRNNNYGFIFNPIYHSIVTYSYTSMSFKAIP